MIHNEPSTTTASNVEIFLRLLFSVIFLFACCLVLMLYVHKAFGLAVQLFLRYCILPSTSRIRLGGIFIAPLSCRLFIQDLFYQDENLSLRVVDGYVSFVFWDTWWKDVSWTSIRDFMVSEDLKGMRCRAVVKLQWVHGVIVEVVQNGRKVRVRLDRETEENASPITVTTGDRSSSSSCVELDTRDVSAAAGSGVSNNHYDVSNHSNNNNNSNNNNSNNNSNRGSNNINNNNRNTAQSNQEETRTFGDAPLYSSTNMEPMFSPMEDDEEEEEDTGETRLFDVDAVQIPQKRGKVRVHLNGMGLSLYNATWNYKKLSSEGSTPTQEEQSTHRNSLHGWALRSIMSRFMTDEEGDSLRAEEVRRGHSERLGNDDNIYDEDAKLKAQEQQRQLKQKKSLFERFYDFIQFIEVELFASYVDIGGAGAPHPYFMHIGFKRGEGRTYLTQDGLPSIDLYRFVAEMTLEDANARWCSMKNEKESSNIAPQQEQNNTWRDSFVLMFRGTSPNEMHGPTLDDSSSLIRNYGMILNGKEKSTVHIVFYRDVTNVYAGEDVSRRSQLPHIGLEVLIDAPELSYGPWSHYSLMKLKEFFYPTTYMPLEPLKFELGQPRPLAGFDIFVEFLCDTSLIIPFKRKSPAPSPPFGIRDSGRKGVIFLTLGRGSQYIQKPQFLLQGEKKQVYESLFSAKNIWMATNAIQESSTVLAHAQTLDLFIDRLDDRAYNGRKLWNILPSLGEGEAWWYMEYISFFMDLINDWQFVPQMYHGEPLSTEIYNTYKQFVKEFIPNVKRFEVFFNGVTRLHVNTNPQNVVFSENINDNTANTFLTFSVKNGGHFFMTLPSDAYLLNSLTEVHRPFELSLQDIEAFLTLPLTHPLCEMVDATKPFAQLDELSLKGSQVVHIPNQTVPQDKNPVDPTTGQTKLTNYLDIEINLTGLRGFVMAPHICALLDAQSNLFGASVCVIRPDELFWPLSKIQPKMDLPKNVRQRFNDFIQKDEPRSNDQEISVTLTILDVDVTVQAGRTESPKLNLCCGKFSFSLIRHCITNDITITLTPVCGRFFDQNGDDIVNDSFICCGNITFSMLQHFGPLPFRTLFHGATDIMVEGFSFDLTVEQVAMLTQLFAAFMEQFPMRDARMVQEIEKARTMAAYSAENLVSRGVRTRRNSSWPTTEGGQIPQLESIENNIYSPGIVERRSTAAVAADVREALQRYLALDGAVVQTPFSELVPESVAARFHEYLESFAAASDKEKDYAVVTTLASVNRGSGCVRIGPDSYLELQLPHGVQFAASTLNDTNSNSRQSLAVRSIALRGFCRQDSNEFGKSSDDFSEVFCIETSLRVRQYTAYPFDGGLEAHLEKQRQFVEMNDLQRGFSSEFQRTPETPVRRSYMSEPQTAPPSRREEYLRKRYEDGPLGEEDMPQQERDSIEQSTILQIRNFEHQLSFLQDQATEVTRDNTDGSSELVNQNTMLSVSGINNNTSQRFLTCVSATDLSDSEEEEEEEEEKEEDVRDDDDSSSSSGSKHLAKYTFDTTQVSHEKTSSVPLDMEKDGLMMRPSESFSSFLRPFFLHSLGGDENVWLKYNKPSLSGVRGPRDRTYFNAEIPSTVFFAAMEPHRSPQFRMAQEEKLFLQRTGVSSSNNNTGNNNSEDDEEADVWALRRTDNSKRSQEGSTSKHLHVEAVSPLIALVTPQFVRKICFDAEMRFLALVRHYQRPPDTPSTCTNLPTVSECDRTGGFTHQTQHRKRRGIHKKDLSKNRVHQKRWLSAVRIISVILPCIEVKVLTELPVPPENMAPNTTCNGVYTTMLGVRSFQFVMQRTLPPAHAAINVEKTVISASITLSSLAIITQVEYEPVVRHGNLHIKIPGVVYDDEKDTLAVAYLTSFCGRGRRTTSQGMQNGSCHITVDTMAFHITRDFFHYVWSMKALFEQLSKMRLSQNQKGISYSDLQESINIFHLRGNSMRDFVFPRLAQQSEYPFLSTDYGIEANLILQGVASINCVRIELFDVTREGKYLQVSTNRPSFIEIKRPSAKFLAKVPMKGKGESGIHIAGNRESAFTSTPSALCDPFLAEDVNRPVLPPERHRKQRRDAQVNFIGEVDSLLIKCYPSLLHIFGAAKEKSLGVLPPSNRGISQRHMSNVVCELLNLSEMNAPGGGIGVVFVGSFALHQLDVSMLYSELNFMQFKGSKITGCGESRTEHVSSRECVQTHVLTAAISERIREKLRQLAKRARERAPNSRCAAPPSVTPQLHLKSSAVFFAETMFLQYVADVIVPGTTTSSESTTMNTLRGQEESSVFIAVVKNIALCVHKASQNVCFSDDRDPKDYPEKDFKVGREGEQINLQIDVGKITVSSPYRPQATETVRPQLHEWLQGWMDARKILQAMRDARATSTHEGSLSFSGRPGKRMHAWFCAMQIHDVQVKNDLPQGITLELDIPLVSAFLTASSDQRLALKTHFHPFTLTSKSFSTGHHAVELPSVYIIYAKDEVRQTGTCLMQSVEIQVSPIIITHVLLILERLVAVREALLNPISVEEEENRGPTKFQIPKQIQSKVSLGLKDHFLFLLAGLRISYLTSMTNLRFSIRRLSVTTDKVSWGKHRKANIAANVSNAQVALVDRDDYDQLQAALRQAAMYTRSESSVPSTKAALLLHRPAFARSSELPQTVRPLSGFIWGLFEASFSLSSGRSDINELRAVLENLLVDKPVSPVDLRELNRLGSTATRWNISVTSPLIIARIGLIPLLQQSIDETTYLVEEIRFAAQREGRLFHRQLTKSAAYRRLVRVRKQMEAVKRKSERLRIERLRNLTAGMVPRNSSTFQRRPSLSFSSDTAVRDSMEEDLFNATSDSKFVATVSNFLVVIPFGDAAYRSILEELPDVYVNGRGDPVLNRKKFIPTMALKMKVEKITFICGLLKTQRCVPVIPSMVNNDNSSGFLEEAAMKSANKLKFTARFALDDAHLYFSDGSPIKSDSSARELLGTTHILGGLGTLTSSDRKEYRYSLSKLYLNSIDIPLHITKQGNEVKIGATAEMSAPRVTLSTRFVSILSQLIQEIPLKAFPPFPQQHAASNATSDGTITTTVSSATVRGVSVESDFYVDPVALLEETKSIDKKTPLLYSFDVTARIDRGEVIIYSVQKDSTTGAPVSSQTGEDLTSKNTRLNRRRVRFSIASDKSENTLPSPPATTTNTAAGGGVSLGGSPMAALLTIPIPDITARVVVTLGGNMSDEEQTIIRVEIRANTVEIGPSILSLAQEIEEWMAVYDRDKSERTGKILAIVKEWEKDITNSILSLHSPIADVALPLPRAFAAGMAQIRANSSNVSAIRRHRGHQRSWSLPTRLLSPSKLGPIQKVDTKKSSFMSIHIRLTGFRLVLTTEPVSTVGLSLFLEERGGSLDFFVKRVLGKHSVRFVNTPAATPPVVSFFLCVRRLRVECQAKLEVKSFEMDLPELEMCAALRRRSRHRKTWSLMNFSVCIPPSGSGGTELSITLHATHLSQLFIVQELWHRTLYASLHSIRQMFARGAHIIKENVSKNPVIQRRMASLQKIIVEETLMVVLTASHSKVRIDLGSGNAQQASLGGINFALQSTKTANHACRKVCFDLAVRSFMLRSEGVLSGAASLENGFLKGFLIENADGVKVLTRSPGGRTFRQAMCTQKLHIMFKERQLKDVFECHVGEFSGNAMDGVGEEDSATVHAEMFLRRGNVLITPSTVPAFLSTIRIFSEIVAAQQKVTAEKLIDSGVQGIKTSLTEKMKDVVRGVEWVLDHRNSTGVDKSANLLSDFPETAGAANALSDGDRKANVSTVSKEIDNSKSNMCILFMGNPLTRIPCGQFEIKVEQTTLLLGNAPKGMNTLSSLVAVFPRATLSFAECPSEGRSVIKKMLVLDAENVELFRPGSVKVLILGFRGPNKFEFYSRQKIGESEVGFVLSLDQAHPWTGNPRFQDFQEMIQLARSFTAKSNAEVFQHFGEVDHLWPNEREKVVAADDNESKTVKQDVETKPVDERRLKALKNVKFSPHLRFGGDVAVNIDVILNWLGISEKMLPYIIHVKLCDKMEALLNHLYEKERTNVS
ncbi:uncharacterized protein TM35_000631180 [Trypanosoma theileri]|uniref:Fragile site-associated protein C-terminal domain-containing protein n=1 Tax=Trypanosoma theileri TaxID=67003 RepID=A0A1X0NGH1_9TRYP|nr:uncharacterized protein TM35_000631180 [Trypanosoma theileri]ORC83618.1 hypothetical protein TM35_000631180 [Trypanosoma theileri]